MPGEAQTASMAAPVDAIRAVGTGAAKPSGRTDTWPDRTGSRMAGSLASKH
jgi:hypothetical protein